MSVTIECIIRDYILNKVLYDERVIELIHKLNNEINNIKDKSFELADAVLPAPSEVHSGKTNCKVDASYNVLARYNYLSNKIKEENTVLVNEMLDYLNYLADLKKLYGQISFVAITLEPRQSRSLEILMDGGKFYEVASELDVSYITARRTIDAAIKNLTEAIADNLKERILKDYEKYSCCILLKGKMKCSD